MAFVNVLAWTARHTPLGRGSSRRFMVKLARKLTSGPIETAFRGVPIIAYPDTFKPVFSTAYDRQEMNFLLRHLQAPDAVFVDIGANFGIYSQWLGSKMAPTARLIAIEPTEKAEKLRANLLMLKQPPEYTIFNWAVSDKEGWLDFEGETVMAGGSKRLFARPLLDLIQEAGCRHISALKIDIEGHEDRALAPFFRSAPKGLWPKAIVLEHVHSNHWSEDLFSLLQDATYRVVKKTRANLLMARDICANRQQAGLPSGSSARSM